MSLNILRLAGIMALLVFTKVSLADVEMSNLDSFHELPKKMAALKALGWLPEQTLIAMDGDDTLTRMPCPVGEEKSPRNCQYVGGPAWFTWQSDLLPSQGQAPSSACKKYCVAETFSGLLDISAYLFAASRMEYAEAGQAKPLEVLALEGVRLMGLTARGDTNISATEMQFSYLPLTLTPTLSLFDLINKNAPYFHASPFSGEVASIASPFLTCAGKVSPRPETYRNGTFYASGQNKGVALKCFLKAYSRSPQGSQKPIKNIIFIDDSLQNIKDVNNAFEATGTYNVRAYHFTYLQAHKALLTQKASGKPYREMAKKRWDQLNSTLERALLEPSVGSN